VLALPCVLYSMDLTVLNLAVPRLSADLKSNSTELLDRGHPQAGRPDILSAALCIATVLAVIYGVKRVAGHRADWVAAVTIVAGC
jgi:MFS transporter, DHA2 family, multidrug resistance protein